jgi:hypothetical protein
MYKRNTYILVILFLSWTSSFCDKTLEFEKKLFDPSLHIPEFSIPENAWFGQSVDVSNDTLVVGTSHYDNKGTVFVFQRENNRWSLKAQLTASNLELHDSFGYSVAIDGDTIVVGAPEDNGLNNKFGSVYVFVKPEGEWIDTTETAKLTASSPSKGFGLAVDIDGGIIVVGAPFTDSNNLKKTGEVFLFYKSRYGWETTTESAKLNPPMTDSNNFFGSAVAISNDVIVIGVPNAYEGSGTAYVFQKHLEGWTGSYRGELQATNLGSYSYFGRSVDISNDNIVIGTTSNNPHVYVYEKPVSGWSDMVQTATLTPSTSYYGYKAGWDVSIYNNTVIASEEKDFFVFIFDKPDTGWSDINETAVLNHSSVNSQNYGYSLVISDDIIAVGARDDFPYTNQMSSVLIYEKSKGKWINQAETFRISVNDNTEDWFGTSIAYNDEIVAVGVPHAQKVVLYKYENQSWIHIGTLTEDRYQSNTAFGKQICMINNMIAVSAPSRRNGMNKGIVYVFEKPETGWTSLKPTADLQPADDMLTTAFGDSIAISENTIVVSDSQGETNERKKGLVCIFEKPSYGWQNSRKPILLKPSFEGYTGAWGQSIAFDGTTIFVSDDETNGGAVYVFEQTDGSWEQPNQTAIIQPTDLDLVDSENGFGSSIYLTHQGLFVCTIGYPIENTRTSAVYYYEKPETGWKNVTDAKARFLPSDLETNTSFGESLLATNEVLLIGAPLKNEEEGAVYLYERPLDGENFTMETKIITTSNDQIKTRFGNSIAYHNNYILIGSMYDNIDGNHSGSVHVYKIIDETTEIESFELY